LSSRLEGRYQLRREVARGQRSVVYQAQHRFTLRSVALKVLYGPAARDETQRDVLLAEARLVTELRLLEVEDGLTLALGVCSALACVHESGVVHQAVSPQNLFLPLTGQVVSVNAVARWRREARDGRGATGLQFVDLDEGHRKSIAQYVEFFGVTGDQPS
jgi:hypothetical protein